MPLPNRGSRRAMMLVAVVAGLAGETVEISFLALDLADQFGLGRAVRLEVVVAGDGADILQFHFGCLLVERCCDGIRESQNLRQQRGRKNQHSTCFHLGSIL